MNRVQDEASLGKAGARKTFQHTTTLTQTLTGHEHHQMHKQGNQQHKDWITKTTEKTDLKLYQVGTTYMTCVNHTFSSSAYPTRDRATSAFPLPT